MLPNANLKVYLATGSTDMRKSVNGLSILINLPNAMTKDDFKELMPRYIDPPLMQIKP